MKRINNIIKLDGVSKKFGGRYVLKNISFEIKDLQIDGRVTGQVASILGPSGIGKTRLLKLISGLDAPNEGLVSIGDKPTYPGRVGVVFQDYPLFEGRTVIDNLVLSGELSGMRAADIHSACEKYISLLRLGGCESKYPAQISGGMRQRVAIARQLMNAHSTAGSRVIALDEPFSALDPIAINDACKIIRECADENESNTFVIVTHDVRAALAVSDQIIMLEKIDDHGEIAASLEIEDKQFPWSEERRSSSEFMIEEDKIRKMFVGLATQPCVAVAN